MTKTFSSFHLVKLMNVLRSQIEEKKQGFLIHVGCFSCTCLQVVSRSLPSLDGISINFSFPWEFQWLTQPKKREEISVIRNQFIIIKPMLKGFYMSVFVLIPGSREDPGLQRTLVPILSFEMLGKNILQIRGGFMKETCF